jgi:tetratricopeptide (TPR) repeat protein
LNWPQHHRPATFLPTAWELDEGEGIIWCSDHDPFARMKGMHGVRLQAGSTVVELLVRLFNRSDVPQTFLWWANVAAEVHADYQSFFPADVGMVADHAKRAVSTFPTARSSYYGIDYPSRRHLDTRPDSELTVPGDRLDWPRNIPVPTSYMALGSSEDFFGGYDHRAQAGFVHWADHHYAVGKKQWTWGDAEFGRAWAANLTDNGSTYIELMAGVFTDNQPDFSHLAPGETKSFSQYWYPIAGTGPAVAASLEVALGIEVGGSTTTLRLDATRDLGPVELVVTSDEGRTLHRGTTELNPLTPMTTVLDTVDHIHVALRSDEATVLTWSTPALPSADGISTTADGSDVEPAREPDAPPQIDSVEELYLTGQHLEQYRHATRSPEPYWAEALTRDPGHAPTNTAVAARHYQAARYTEAERHLRLAIKRLTVLNPNPEVGEAHYLLGLTLVRLGRRQEAYALFAKATWLDAWVANGNHQLAILDAQSRRDQQALERADTALRARPDHRQVRNLRVVLLRRLQRNEEAEQALAEALASDPLDIWTRYLAANLDPAAGHTEAQTLIDVAMENARIGELDAALELLALARDNDARRPLGQAACGLISDYLAAAIYDALGDTASADRCRARARAGDRTWNFAARLDDVASLQVALAADDTDATAAALLGHWCYAHGRVDDAVAYWQQSARHDATDPVVWRNLAVAAFNQAHDAESATTAYQRALAEAPDDSKLMFESDQLLKRIGAATELRLARLEQRSEDIGARDDLSVEYVHLLLNAQRPTDAHAVLAGRQFQPWEGGEGQVLRAWERTQLALAHDAAPSDPVAALAHVRSAIETPRSLGEARHPLANPARLLLALGDALAATGAVDEAAVAWRQSAGAVGDFFDMSPRAYSENTFFSVLAARRLDHTDAADRLVAGLEGYIDDLARTPAKIDYFATSLPSLLLFDDDPQRRQDVEVELLRAQVALLAGEEATAGRLLDTLLSADPSHERALDLRHSIQPTGSLS